jgi:hypothetical protein
VTLITLYQDRHCYITTETNYAIIIKGGGMNIEEDEIARAEPDNDRAVPDGEKVEKYCKSVETLLANLQNRMGPTKWSKHKRKKKYASLIASNKFINCISKPSK